MKLSVIVPCYNAEDTLGVQLEALARQKWSEPWEVIVADNASTDGSLAVVEQFRHRLPNLRIVLALTKRGVSHTMNAGASVAQGESIAFCDADDEVAPGWLAAIGDALTVSDIVASRHDFEKLNRLWTQKNCKWVTQQHKLERTRFHPYLFHAGTCGLAAKRWLHEAVGGFDESLPVLSDVDYCFKTQLQGATLRFVPGAVVHVRRRERLGDSFKQARMWAKYNVLMYKRYHTPGVKFPRPWRHYLYYWLQFMGDLKHVRSKEDYAKLVWFFGWQLGLLQGSIRFCGPPLPI